MAQMGRLPMEGIHDRLGFASTVLHKSGLGTSSLCWGIGCDHSRIFPGKWTIHLFRVAKSSN